MLALACRHNILAAPPSVANAEIALLAAKTMWSAIQTDIPPMLLSPGAIEPWFEIVLGLLNQELPTEGNPPTDNEEAAKWAPWKLKKRVAQIMHRVIQRYGNPGSGKEKALTKALTNEGKIQGALSLQGWFEKTKAQAKAAYSPQSAGH